MPLDKSKILEMLESAITKVAAMDRATKRHKHNLHNILLLHKNTYKDESATRLILDLYDYYDTNEQRHLALAQLQKVLMEALDIKLTSATNIRKELTRPLEIHELLEAKVELLREEIGWTDLNNAIPLYTRKIG